MSEKRQKGLRPAVLFGEKSVKKIGYIDDYIFACEIEGEDHIRYPKPRKPKYHLVIIVMEGYINMVINGEKFRFGSRTYINLPTWVDIYEIEYGGGFHAMTTATDKSVVEDIFRNRNPFPPDFKFRIDHGLGGQIMAKNDMETLCRDIRNMIDSLSNKNHYFAEEVNYAYFYILLTVKEKLRVTIGTVMASMRIEMAARMLRDPELTIQQVAEAMSFSDQSSFGKFFKKHTGLSPLKYRQNLKKTLLTLRPKEVLNPELRNLG